MYWLWLNILTLLLHWLIYVFPVQFYPFIFSLFWFQFVNKYLALKVENFNG